MVLICLRGLLTVVLPLITGVSTYEVYGLINQSNRREQNQLTIPLIAIIGFQLIYETIIATLSLTYLIPPNSLHCGLNDKWQQLFVARDERSLKTIQDSFDCCGFKTPKDRAWPFREQKPSPCAEALGRTKSCLGEWKKAEQVNAGLFLLVALVVFIIKVQPYLLL